MKNVLKIEEMMSYLPAEMRDAISNTSRSCGVKVDSLELHRHSHSEKSKTNQLEPEKRQSLSYVSVRTQDRDDEIVIPEALDLKSFLSYRHVLVNHNYSLLPIGSDEYIEADSWGLKALTNHADTGQGTLANVIWALVSQGHMNAKSIGFVPTSFTKPGARDWDHVTNQLQDKWSEFDKARAEKSISRIITGGVLLEHSFVSVPANSDSVVIGVVKAMNLNDKVIKQLGWEVKVEKVPCVCDECGYMADVVPGEKCPECKTGDMKPKGKEKAVWVMAFKDFASFAADNTPDEMFPTMKPYPNEHAARQTDPGKYKRFARQKDKGGDGVDFIFGITADGKTELQSIRFDKDKFTPEQARKWLKEHDMAETLEEAKGEEKQVVNKQDDDKGDDLIDSLKRKLVSIQRGAEGATLDKADELMKKLGADPDEDELEALKDQINGLLASSKKAKPKQEIKIVRSPSVIKVIYTPPDPALVAKSVGDAVERAIARRTGKIM